MRLVQFKHDQQGDLPALRVACRYSPVGFDRQHILARLVGPPSATTPAAEMTGLQDQAPDLPVTKPVTYEELTPGHKQKYDEVKAQFEADLIGSFERTRNHGIRWKGFSLEGALDNVDLSVPSCNTRFIKGHKPSNHIRARIKSHVYTTE